MSEVQIKNSQECLTELFVQYHAEYGSQVFFTNTKKKPWIGKEFCSGSWKASYNKLLTSRSNLRIVEMKLGRELTKTVGKIKWKFVRSPLTDKGIGQ